jgi:peptidoglycan/LPS O-acetylase OafA/YrhL
MPGARSGLRQQLPGVSFQAVEHRRGVTFYFVFPALAAVITTLPRAAILVVAALLLAVLGNDIAAGWLMGYSEAAARWFPNQAPVFDLGFVLYFLVSRTGIRIRGKPTAYLLLTLTVATCVFAAEYPTASNRFNASIGVPPILIATLCFMGFIFVLARSPETLFTHRWIRRVGTLSFSAYVLNFLFVDSIPGWTYGLIDRQATGYAAIGAGAALWILAVSCTVAAAAVCHRLIEQPGIALAQRLTSSRLDALAERGIRKVMSGA